MRNVTDRRLAPDIADLAARFRDSASKPCSANIEDDGWISNWSIQIEPKGHCRPTNARSLSRLTLSFTFPPANTADAATIQSAPADAISGSVSFFTPPSTPILIADFRMAA